MLDLQDIRMKIDEVDLKLLELFEYRMKLAVEVAEYKKSVNMPVYDAAREEEKIEAIKSMTINEFNKAATADLFKQIMAVSRRLQYTMSDTFFKLGFTAAENFSIDKDTRIVYYGEKGAYTEQAMLEYFVTCHEGIPMATFGEVMQAIKEGKSDYGVLPIENSATGTLSDIFDLLAEYDNYIIGEHVMKIDHNLWGLPGSSLSDINSVYSHRQGLMQCSSFLKSHGGMRQVESGSTAGSARRVLEEGDKSKAAIASRKAGEQFGLQLLQASIQNDNTNSTRFIIITNRKAYIKGAGRTSICFEAPHKTGSLYHILANFIYNNINMTRIESRPIHGKAFKYRFFVDIDGSLNEPSVNNALHCINEEALELKILGCYKPIVS